MQERGAGRPPGAVIVRARPMGTIVLGSVTALLVIALVAAEGAQPATSGRVVAAVFFGLFILLSVGAWLGVNASRRQLEVGRDAIVSRPGTKGKPFTLARDEGDTLRLLPAFTMLRQTRVPRLFFLGRAGFIELRNFRLDPVRRACEAQGWRFDGDPALAAHDVQHWLNLGRSVEAAQLIQVVGPFPAAAASGDAHAGLDAAVYGDFGDKIARKARGRARQAYRLAASAQQAFAGRAGAPGEAAARMAEAQRIEAKARG